MASRITKLSNLGFFFLGHIRIKIWDVYQPQQPIIVQQLSATIVEDCRNMPVFLLQNAFNDMVNRYRKCQNAAGIPSPLNNVINDQLASNLVYICLHCLTKISVRAKRSISRVFSLFIVPSPFFVHCPYKGRINRAESPFFVHCPYKGRINWAETLSIVIVGFCHCF